MVRVFDHMLLHFSVAREVWPFIFGELHDAEGGGWCVLFSGKVHVEEIGMVSFGMQALFVWCGYFGETEINEY